MRNFIVFDLESTCGWENEHRQSEIIEIGAVKVNEKLEIVDEFQSFIRPVINPELTPFCTKLTTITQANVDNADTFQHVFTEFISWCGNADTHVGKISGVPFYLCSWGFYDKKMLKQDCEYWSIGPSSKWFDNNHISIKHQHGAIMAREMREQGVPKSQYKNISRGVGMSTALQMFNIPLEGTHHRGIDDARNITKLFIQLYPQLKFE